MSVELTKRIITSIFLFTLLALMYFYTYILIISLIIIAIISWIEFYALISKILYKESLKNKILRFIYKIFSLIFLFGIVFLVLYAKIKDQNLEIFVIYPLLISISTDIGGILFGKIFKGKRLTKLSPNKTISGSAGSFLLSLLLVPFFDEKMLNHGFMKLIIFTLLISLISQISDILISAMKRKAKVKDTSDLLPGHGGFLDRIDGMLLALPLGFMILKFL